jgi:hypothetical protein
LSTQQAVGVSVQPGAVVVAPDRDEVVDSNNTVLGQKKDRLSGGRGAGPTGRQAAGDQFRTPGLLEPTREFRLALATAAHEVQGEIDRPEGDPPDPGIDGDGYLVGREVQQP